MDRFDLVLAMLDSNGGKVDGRTVVQKLGYFASKCTRLEGVHYRDFFYGPFSKAVALALEDLGAAMLLYEIVRSSPIESYTYVLTDDGRTIVKEVKERCRRECAVIDRIVSVCRDRCNLEAHPLACAAKSHYMMEHGSGGEDRSPAGIEAMVRDFGWNLGGEEIRCGVGLLKALDLPRGGAADRGGAAGP